MTAPALPSGWTSTLVTGDPPSWENSTTSPDTAPNAVFVNDQDGISDKVLDSRNILINSAAAQITFRNNYDTEYDPPPAEVFWDGFVLEVSVNGGAFVDVTDPSIGGSFVSGGYTGEIDGTANNPLAGRFAWCGDFRGLHQLGDQPWRSAQRTNDQAAFPDGNRRSGGAAWGAH